MPLLHHLIYLSSATVDFSVGDLEDMVERASERNASLSITGLLLYIDGCFMQCLEGAKDNIDALFTRICEDDRHTGILRVILEPIENRSFPDWRMAFRRLPGETLKDIPGFSHYLNRPYGDQPPSELPDTAARKVKILFDSFRQNQRYN